MLILSTLLFAQLESIWLMMMSRFFQGTAGAFIWTAVLAAAAALYPRRERGGRLGLMMAITGLGTITGPVISGFVSNRWGYQAPFWGTALVIVTVIVLLLLLKLPDAPGSRPAAGAPEPAGFFQGLANPEVLMVMLLIVASSFSFGMLEPLLPLHLSGVFALDSRGIGIVFGVLGLAYTVFEPLMGMLSDRVGYRPLILAGLAGTAVILPILTQVAYLPLLYVTCCLYSLVSCAMMVPCLPLLAEHSDAGGGDGYGRQFGLANAAYSLGLLLGPAMGGVMAQYASFFGATLFSSTLLLVLGVSILRRFRAGNALNRGSH